MKEEYYTSYTGKRKKSMSFIDRIRAVKRTRWIRFTIVSIIFFLWVIWMSNPWLLFWWLLLLDIYITGYIPWSWWKESKSPIVKTIMTWVDAIVYALVLVYFIFAFIGQNYQIPSSSLEKSLLVGDYLWVNKTLYGPRVPQTPIHFPLTQHTLPILNTKSYLENPQLKYHRLAGIRSIERGDIVVFNYPQGDTVPTMIDPKYGDYYAICHQLKASGVENPKEFILRNPDKFGKLIWRPVDRRENYVKRCIGLPGERLKIVNDVVYINGKAIAQPKYVQFNYLIPVSSVVTEDVWSDMGVRQEDYQGAMITDPYTGQQYYNLPLTEEMKAQVEKLPQVTGKLIKESETGLYDLGGVWPLDAPYGWTRPNMGEFWIPQKGKTLHLTLQNLPVYERAIRTYEGNTLEVKDGKIYINGTATDHYTFQMDYYWMMGDNRDRSADSRYWGLVPEDHIVGSPMLILISFDEDRSFSDGKIRWNRIFRNPNPDKEGRW
jgi:signal peptidase I